MKRILMITAVLAFYLNAPAQKGTVTYQETMKLDIHIEGDMAGMQDMLPKERKVTRILHYTSDASLYLVQANTDEQEVSEQAGGGNVVIKVQEPDDKRYTDLKAGKITEQKEFMSRNFLIESPAEAFPWKLTGSRKDICGIPCIEASFDKDSTHTVAWFAPSLAVPAGPGKYGGLPGLILEVNMDNGKRIITAVSVKDEDVAGLIVKPTKGKKVTREEFDAIVKEKTGQDGKEGGAVFMIQMTR